MNEDQIVQQLASSAPQEPTSTPVPVIEEGAPQVPEPESGLEPQEQKDPFIQAQNKAQLNQYFGVIPGTYRSMEVAEHIDNILSFASQEVGSDNMADIILYIRGIEQAIGSKHSLNRLSKLNQFVVIRNQARLLEQKQAALRG